MYRLQLLNMTHGSAGLSPEAIANIYQIDRRVLPIDLKCPIADMTPCSELFVYCLDVGELPGMLSPTFIFSFEKPNGVGRPLDSGPRSRGLYAPSGAPNCRKFRCFSTKGLNWIEFTCCFTGQIAQDASLEAAATQA